MGDILKPPALTDPLPRGTVLDSTGNPIALVERPPEGVAETGRVRDVWSQQVINEVTPAALARMLRNDYPLPQQMALGKRALNNDGHGLACYRDLVLSVAGNDWEVLPFDKSSRSRREADQISEWLYAIDTQIEKLLAHLCFGEYMPLAGAEIRWSDDYLPIGFEHVDPVRWWWEPSTNSLKIRTVRNPWMGEDLQPAGFIIHRSQLVPGARREGGLWRAYLWLYLFKHYTFSDWMQFAAIYGKPFRTAFYQRPEDKPSILQAMQDLGVNAAGVFPAGTVVELMQANGAATADVYKGIREACNDEMGELFNGHSLITHAKSGTGTLAGKGAQTVADKIVRQVSRGLGGTVREYLIKPLVAFQFGKARAQKAPRFKLKYEPPEDLLQKAKTFVFINQALAPSEEAIDPQQIRDDFNIVKTVPVKKKPVAPDQNLNDPAAAGDGEEMKASLRARKSAGPALQTADEIEELGAQLGARGLQQFAADAAELLDRAGSLEEFRELLWEHYGDFDADRLTALTRDTTLTAVLAGRGDVSR
jgi:phage gp29-like protein